MVAGRLWLGLALALGILAYRSLLGSAVSPKHAASLEADAVFFGAHELSPWLILPLAGWLLWRRLPAYQALPDKRSGGALPVLLLGAIVLTWARLASAPDLLLISLAANLVGAAWWLKGCTGARQVALPALVVLVALPIPSPIRNELLWWLQVLTTWSSVTLLDLVGYEDVYGSGIVIHLENQYFQVIEACSGLRGIQILLLVSILIRELFRYAGTRMWWLVACAPLVGFVANAIRVGVIALATPELAPDAAARQDHTTQGLAVVMGGTVALYALGRLLEGRSSLPEETTGWHLPNPGVVSACWLGALAGLSFLPELELHSVKQPHPIELPDRLGGWVGETLRPDRLYLGSLPLSNILEWRYTRPSQPQAPPVYVFIGYQDVARQRDSLLASKLSVPGREWSPNGSEPQRLWVLDRDIERVLAARPHEQAVSYLWHRDESSALVATLRSLLALPRGKEAGTYDVVVRISTSLVRVGPVARDHAEQRLDAFAKAFRVPLSQL